MAFLVDPIQNYISKREDDTDEPIVAQVWNLADDGGDYDGVTGKEIASGSVAAIIPNASLIWVGFSTDDSLCVMDSDDMLSTLILLRVLDLRFLLMKCLSSMGIRQVSMPLEG